MQDNNYEDELARRRAARNRTRDQEDEELPEEEELPKLGWKDTVALIIAAYQVLFPMLLAMGGALLVVYLLFRWYFH